MQKTIFSIKKIKKIPKVFFFTNDNILSDDNIMNSKCKRTKSDNRGCSKTFEPWNRRFLVHVFGTSSIGSNCVTAPSLKKVVIHNEHGSKDASAGT